MKLCMLFDTMMMYNILSGFWKFFKVGSFIGTYNFFFKNIFLHFGAKNSKIEKSGIAFL